MAAGLSESLVLAYGRPPRRRDELPFDFGPNYRGGFRPRGPQRRVDSLDAMIWGGTIGGIGGLGVDLLTGNVGGVGHELVFTWEGAAWIAGLGLLGVLAGYGFARYANSSRDTRR